jgi:formate/nitrite transporter FocA (FNT family)
MSKRYAKRKTDAFLAAGALMADDEQAEESQDQKKKDEAEERSAPSGSVVYHAIRQEGEDELERSTSALAWSGLAAGLSMGFSLVAQGLLRSHLPDAPWRPLVVSLGYPIGFLIVVLGRQQLFTENTLTVILPLLAKRDGTTLRNVARLWTVVLLANLFGAFLFALTIAKTQAFEDGAGEAFMRLGEEAMRAGFAVTLLRGIFAGWLIALMVWLLPFAESARVWVIVIVTYVVGLGGLSHVIAGSVETMYLAFIGRAQFYDVIAGYVLPALFGNIIGGVALVAAISHAQIVAGEDGVDA